MTRLSSDVIEFAVRQMRAIRGYLLGTLENVDDNVWTVIVPPYRNNVLWNAGHVITDQCNMIYEPCGMPLPIPDGFKTLFDPGTSPEDWTEPPVASEVVECAAGLCDIIESDLRRGAMDDYTPAVMEDGAEFRNVLDAIGHATSHEAYHLGTITSMMKTIAAR